jgi:hypothetical protein
MAFTDYLENKLLAHTFSNTAYTSPSTVYVALYTTLRPRTRPLAQKSQAALTRDNRQVLQRPQALQPTQQQLSIQQQRQTTERSLLLQF